MALGYSSEVMNRLWHLIEGIQKGLTRAELATTLGLSERMLQADLHRLRSTDIPIRYFRSSDLYQIDWPDMEQTVRLTPEQLFYALYVFSSLGEESATFTTTKQRFLTSILPEVNPIHDCGPAYGLTKNVNGYCDKDLVLLAEAIQDNKKLVFLYQKNHQEQTMREVHPYKLLHSPISWYLLAWCVDAKDWRIFKIVRMTNTRILKDSFSPIPYDLAKILGDAWWVRHDPARIHNPYEIKVLFKGEAAMHIKEYHFHPTQNYEDTPQGTIVSWRLSYLEEFASWLMQWLGTIEIITCEELKQSINKRIKSFT